jgi:hypothetical protein
MDKGGIAERGTHSQLLNAGGLYARMLRVQLTDDRALEINEAAPINAEIA